MTAPRPLRVAVANPLGLAGKELRSLLRERHFPISSMSLLDAEGSADGAITEDDGEAAWVRTMDDDALDGLDLLFLLEPNDDASRRGAAAAVAGTTVVEIRAVPAGGATLVAPSVGALPASDVGRHFAVPSPAALLIARLLAPIEAVAPIRSAVATILEPISPQGDAALEEMLGQSVALLNFRPLPKNVLGRQRVFNVYGTKDDPGPAIREELSRLFGRSLPLSVVRLEGPSFHGHGLSLLFELDPGSQAEAAQLAESLGKVAGIRVDRGETVPGTVEASGTDEIAVATLQAEAGRPGAFRLWAVADHLRVGPILEAIRVAEAVFDLEAVPAAAPRRRRGLK